ncbi:hypothetical protein A2Y99_00340 [Candidatus Gottesmanbacteria bacterium RBG_13_37_7]|uniref:5'-deoxynucleotidase n=1 Tax=Candidatus Gottesmanbacteria bacterium RBG_13_37_7 TaxID=1798369 RepID=A0A1F5YH08_9BACT|nr:MAG: hypothetical protein A2Y99_00340 [Candidatus Gottesmanbacteria bacterium RBG_13_37_7]
MKNQKSIRQLADKNNKSNNKLVNFIFEATTLKRLQRTGWQILGANKESVAEHSFMVAVITYVLAKELHVDLEKALLMALVHDFIETRTGDVYKLADLYVKVDTKSAIEDAFAKLEHPKKIIPLMIEYEKRKTLEAIIVHDADVLALCVELKQLTERGNKDAVEWLEANMGRLKLSQSRKLLQEVKKTNSQNWWAKERDTLHKKMNQV